MKIQVTGYGPEVVVKSEDALREEIKARLSGQPEWSFLFDDSDTTIDEFIDDCFATAENSVILYVRPGPKGRQYRVAKKDTKRRWSRDRSSLSLDLDGQVMAKPVGSVYCWL